MNDKTLSAPLSAAPGNPLSAAPGKAASRISRIEIFNTAILVAIGVGLIVGLSFIYYRGTDFDSAQEARIHAEVDARVEKAVEKAIADYDRQAKTEVARDRELVEQYYAQTVREVDSYVEYRLDEALLESNRIIEDAIRDAEKIRADAAQFK